MDSSWGANTSIKMQQQAMLNQQSSFPLTSLKEEALHEMGAHARDQRAGSLPPTKTKHASNQSIAQFLTTSQMYKQKKVLLSKLNFSGTSTPLPTIEQAEKPKTKRYKPGSQTPILDKKLQAYISRPQTIFKDLREKQSNSQLRGRREVLKPMVPRVDDEDIVELCKKYKVKLTEEDTTKNERKGGQLQMYNLRQDIKLKQKKLLSNIEREIKKGEKVKFNLFYE